jgi:hypothetical protein
MPNTRTLAQISTRIKALEKRTLQNVVETGKLLEEAADKCEHGQYREWLKTEFGWSHDTARNYRSVYAFAQKTNISSFDRVNISVSALYLVAAMDDDEAAKAIIKAARRGRVTYRMAREIIDKLEPQPPIEPPPAPIEPPPIEPIDDGETPTDEEPPDLEPDENEPPNALASAVNVVLEYPDVNDAAWRCAIKSLGRIKLRAAVEVLQAVYETQCGGRDAVQSKADRAEAALMMARMP